MELQGLEDIPDFWEIDIDEIEQDNVPIMDLTSKLFSTFGSNKVLTNHLAKDKFRQTSSRPQAFSKPVPLLEKLDCLPVDVKKLPNGNYEYVSVVRSRTSFAISR